MSVVVSRVLDGQVSVSATVRHIPLYSVESNSTLEPSDSY